METRTDKITEFYAHDYRDMKMSESDLKDMLEGFVECVECDHICTSRIITFN